MAHDHDHADHGHADHGHADHGHAAGASDRRLGFVVVLNVGIVGAQFVGATLSGSLALAADAAHNAGDAAGLVVSLWARRVARRGADARRTFGYARAETVAALVNLTALVVVSVALGYEAVGRFFDPAPVEGGVMLALGAVGLVGNAASAAALWSGARESLNMRSAVLHLVADAGASAAVMAGAVALMNGGPAWIDPALTVGISLLILRASVQSARAAIAVLMESAPVGLDLDALA